ncbi:uncharacterized protein LOC124631166 isoform X1 [Helicoverpa zea]|uniref:uncharacterized protein LOC124631166 isoform X1 n=1 Tax=Helicoverpa zea TaxID=7113 RepID=UPI001F561603|nr:uncharacterized protein LOC124631166 isoform X1 [Helicoverpa zea]
MLATLKKALKWNSTKSPSENKDTQKSLLFAAFIGLLEDVLFWRKMWMSLSFMFILNIIFFVSVHQQVNLLEFFLGSCTAAVAIDAFESWLKHKHRTSCLKRLGGHGNQLYSVGMQIKLWFRNRWNDFLYLRETNHTKAFLLINMNLILVFLTGKYISGYVLTYLLLMFICVFYKLILPLLKVCKNMKQDLESDCELEGFIPDISQVDINLLSIEPDPVPNMDEKQIYDYWKPEDVPLAECSDSSENSSSLVTNFSIEKLQTLEKDVDSSDTSEDEYIPLDQQKPQAKVQSTLQVVEPASTWGSSAYNAFWNITGAVANMIQTESSEAKRNRLSSIDSSDGFEMIDQNDLT